jgi:hypothetical protein
VIWRKKAGKTTENKAIHGIMRGCLFHCLSGRLAVLLDSFEIGRENLKSLTTMWYAGSTPAPGTIKQIKRLFQVNHMA